MQPAIKPIFLALCLFGCTAEAPAGDAQGRSGSPAPVKHPVLASATHEPGGYPTILYAEPAALGRPVPRHRSALGAPEPGAAAAIRTGRSAAPYLRIFPVMPRQGEPTIDIGLGGTLQLRDGCLRIKPAPGYAREEAIAVFPQGSRAFVDKQGYLTIGVNYPDYASTFRVGEELRFGPGPQVTDPKLVAAIRKNCGAGPLFWLKDPKSSYTRQLNEAAFDAARTAQLRRVSVDMARQKMVEELRRKEEKRRRCAFVADQSCLPRQFRPGEYDDSWLNPPPPPPPQVPATK